MFNFAYQGENSFFTGLHSELVQFYQLLCIFWDASDGCGNILVLLTDAGKERHLLGIQSSRHVNQICCWELESYYP